MSASGKTVFLGVGLAAVVAWGVACSGSDPTAVIAGGSSGSSSGSGTSSGNNAGSGSASSGSGSGSSGRSGSSGGSGASSGFGSGGNSGSGVGSDDAGSSGASGSSGSLASSGDGGSSGSSGSSGSMASSGNAGSGSSNTGTSGLGPNCGKDDPNLAGIEPKMPTTVCKTLAPGADIQAALNSCAGAGAVKLTGASSFSASSLTLGTGAVLWIDAGVTLNLTGSGTPGVINVTGANAGIYGEGTIDAKGAGSGTTMIHSLGDKFVLYKVHLHNSQKMHVKVQGTGFVIWGNTLITPPTASNTDGIDPGAGSHGVPSTGGYIVCNIVTVGDDQIAIKGADGPVSNLTIAHNYFGAGHGMSIGSETGLGGIDGVNVYDLTIDGDYYPGASPVNANAIRIKSYDKAGGPVDHITYKNICARNLHNAILITPNYTHGTVTSGGFPSFGNVGIADFHLLKGSGTQTPVIDITGTTMGPLKTAVTLDNVVVDGLTTPISPMAAVVLVGPGGASPGVMGAVDGTPHPIDCSSRFITFPTN